MIWTLIGRLIRVILRLLVPPPTKNPLPVIDVDAPCPACGNRLGSIKCVIGDGGAVGVKHTCTVCQAKFFEKTVYETLTGQKPEVTV
jgi:hypothetical protein